MQVIDIHFRGIGRFQKRIIMAIPPLLLLSLITCHLQVLPLKLYLSPFYGCGNWASERWSNTEHWTHTLSQTRSHRNLQCWVLTQFWLSQKPLHLIAAKKETLGNEFNSVNMGKCSKKIKIPQGKIKALRNQQICALSLS